MTQNDIPGETPSSDPEAAFKQMEQAAAAQATEGPATPPRESLKPEQKWSLFIALILSLGSPVFFAVSALGTRYGLWDWQFSLGVLVTNWGPKLLFAAIGAAAIALVLSVIRSPRRGVILAVIALVIPVMMLFRMMKTRDMVAALPPIHDVQTDWSRPVALPDSNIALRAENGWNEVLEDPMVSERAAGNWPDAVGQRVSDLQKQAYPDIKPMLIEAPNDVILTFAEGVAEKQGWEIVAVDDQAGTIYATATSTWFGFTDDIVIRVLPQGVAGSRIDVRSVSRVGLSDMGANAKRIKGFLDDAHMAVRVIGDSSEG